MLLPQNEHIFLTALVCVTFMFPYHHIKNYLTFDVEHDFPLNVKIPMFGTWTKSQLFDHIQKSCPYYKEWVDENSESKGNLITGSELCWRQQRHLDKIAVPYDPKKLNDQQLCTALQYRCKGFTECPIISKDKKRSTLEKCLFHFIPVQSLTSYEMETRKNRIFETDSPHLVVTIYSCTPNPYLHKMWRNHSKKGSKFRVRFEIICPLDSNNVTKQYPLASVTWPNGAKLEIGLTKGFNERALSRRHLIVAEKIEAILESVELGLFATSLFLIFSIPLITYNLVISFLSLFKLGAGKVPRYSAWIIFILTVLLICSHAVCPTSIMALLPLDFLIWIYRNPIYNLLTYQCWAGGWLFAGAFILWCITAIFGIRFKSAPKGSNSSSYSFRSEERQEPNYFRSKPESNESNYQNKFKQQSNSNDFKFNTNAGGSSNYRYGTNSNEFRSKPEPPPRSPRRRSVSADQENLIVKGLESELRILKEYEKKPIHYLIQELPLRITPKHKSEVAIKQLTNMKFDQYTSLESLKKAMKKLIALYHTDQIDQSEYGKRYYVLCEEVTKVLNQRNERLKI